MPYKKKASKSSDKAPSVNKKKSVEEDIDYGSDSDNDDLSTIVSESGGSVEDDPVTEYEEYERKIVSGIEMATEKNKKTRINGMKQLISAMQTRSPMYSEIVYKNYFTLCDIVERSLSSRNCSDEEKVAAVFLAKVLVVVCMAMEDHVREISALRCRSTEAVDSPVVGVYQALFPSLLKCLLDTTTSAIVRAAVARAVAVLAYFAAPDSRKLCDAVNALYKAFEGALPKGDGVLPTLSPAQHQLHSAALEGFLLLLSLMKSSDILARRTGLLRDLTETLRTAHLDVRCEAGVGIALLFELLYDDESSAASLRHKELQKCIETLQPLATDAQKFRAKKERKEQRHIFRAVLSTVESEGEFQDHTSHIFRVKGNNTELRIESWEDQIKYEVISAVLGEGLAVHMVYNNGLRKCFCVSNVFVTAKRGKEVKNGLAQQAKFRQQNRNKTRQMRQNAKNILDED